MPTNEVVVNIKTGNMKFHVDKDDFIPSILYTCGGFDFAVFLLTNCEIEGRPVAILHKPEARFVMFADLLVHTAAFVEGRNRNSLVFVSHQSVLAKKS